MSTGKYKELTECIWKGDIQQLESLVSRNFVNDPQAIVLLAEGFWLHACITEQTNDTELAFTRIQQAINTASSIIDQHSKVVKIIKKQKGIFTPQMSSPSRSCTTIEDTLSTEDQKKNEELENALRDEETTNDLKDIIDDEKKCDTPDANTEIQDETSILLKYISARSILGFSLLMDSFLKFKLQRFVKGVYSFRKSWKIFEDIMKLVALIPDTLPEEHKEAKSHIISDANFGIGLFHFLVSIIPPQFLWLVEGAGFKGNRQLGIKELKTSMAANGFRSINAAFCLTWVYSFFSDDFESAQTLLQDWIMKFPSATYLYYLLGSIYRKVGKIDLSIQAFEASVNTVVNNQQYVLYCEFEIGYNYYLQRNWPAALPKLQKFFTESPTPGFKAYAGYQLAICHAMSFQFDKAQEIMKQLLPYVRKNFTYDEYAARRAKHYLENGLSNFDRKFLIAFLQHETHEYEDALDGIDTIQTLASSDIEKAQAYWLKGACLAGTKKYDEAIEPLEKALQFKKKLEKSVASYVLPYSHAILGEVYSFQKQWDKAGDQFKKARQFSGYDFDALLLWRIKKGQDLIPSK